MSVRADAQDDLAHDVDRLDVLGVDRRVARGAGREEQLLVLVGDVELDREAAAAARSSTPVIGSVPLAGSCPWPCAQTIESTLALMMRPG